MENKIGFWLTYGLIITVTGFAIGEVTIRVLSTQIPGVKQLAIAGAKKKETEYKSFEEFISDQPHLIPHRSWANYFNNELGFNDTEFETPKPEGRYRIMALGDSFLYSMVPYPANVMTLTERAIKEKFPNKNIDLLNFGIPATDVAGYRKAFALGLLRYDPDMVILHFYMGNDGPKIFSASRGEDMARTIFFDSQLVRFTINALRVLIHTPTHAELREKVSTATLLAERKRATRGIGGTKVDPAVVEHTEAPERHKGPIFSEESFVDIAAKEFEEMYDLGATETERYFAPIVRELDVIRKLAKAHEIEFVIVAYPSVFQVYDAVREEYIAKVKLLTRYKTLDEKRINSKLANDTLIKYCKKQSVPFFDLTEPLRAETAKRKESIYIVRDTHWNVEGNEIAAKLEGEYLSELLKALLATTD